MQGRLVPPVGWADPVLSRASAGGTSSPWPDEAGLDAIEWIYDEYGADVNPIATDEGWS